MIGREVAVGQIPQQDGQAVLAIVAEGAYRAIVCTLQYTAEDAPRSRTNITSRPATEHSMNRVTTKGLVDPGQRVR